MRTQLLVLACIVLIMGQQVLAVPYLEDEEAMDDYDNNLERLLQNTQNHSSNEDALETFRRIRKAIRGSKIRRSCIRRGANCDHRPNDCCYSSSCRCNLWGANCKCQRMGLFQKWGK